MTNFSAAGATDLNTFTFNGHTLRTVMIDGQPWFKAHDVTAALRVSQGGSSFTDYGHDDMRVLRERNSLFKTLLDGDRGATRGIRLLSESGLYKIVLRAQRSNPAARDFQDWVTKVVLPSIRKDGAYVTGAQAATELTPPRRGPSRRTGHPPAPR